MKNYEPNYTCPCGHTFHTKHDERFESPDGSIVYCPKCKRECYGKDAANKVHSQLDLQP